MNYLRDAWYVASWSQDLEEGKPLAASVLGEPIVLWRAADGVHALEDRCVHRLAPLSLGRCEGNRLRCMYHGFVYGADGQVLEIPGQSEIPPKARVRSYPVIDRHSWIWVWMGDPAKADAGLIPPAVGFDEPDWILGRGYLDYAAEARLINDNLLDFSHLTFVHANSFGAGSAFADSTPKITPLPRGVRFERWVENARSPAGLQNPPVDRWSSYDFLIPGVLLMWSGSFDLGTAAACNHERPDYDKAQAGVTFTSQAVTPSGGKTSRYFFSWGPHRRYGDEALRDTLMGIAGQAFGEDKLIIEAQQRVIDHTENPQVLPTVHDRGVMIFNRLVARLMRESGQPAGTQAVQEV